MKTMLPVPFIAVILSLPMVALAQTPPPTITLDSVPLGPVVATGGGHYNPLPIIAIGGTRTLVTVAKGSRVQAYVDGQPGPVVNAIPVTQTLPIAGILGLGTTGSPQFSADLKRVAYVVSLDNGKQAVVVDATMSPAYPANNAIKLYFAPVDHHFAYVVGAPNGSGSFVVDDGKAGLIYPQGIASEAFSSDGRHFAYVGISASKGLTPLEVQAGKTQPQNQCVVLDGVEQKHFAKIERPIFSQDGKHLAYLAGIDQLSATRAVVDNQEGPDYAGVRDLVISDDGSHSAYTAAKLFPKKETTGGITRDLSYNFDIVVENGKEGLAFNAGPTQIQHLSISHDGGRVAYVVTTNDLDQPSHTVIVDNGQTSQQYRSCESLQISPDGKTVLYVATSAQGTTVLVANGQEYGPFSGTFAPAFSQEGGHWACCVSTAAGAFAVIADGKSIALNGIAPGTLTFQPGTGQLMLRSTTAYNGMPVMIEVKGDAISAADVPSAIAYSPNRQHIARLFTSGYGTSEVKQQLAIDGKSPAPANYTGIRNIALSDDGRHVAYIGEYIGENGKALTHAVCDGAEGPGYFGIKDIALSPDGQHVAYVAEKSNGHGIDTFVVVDGMEGPALQDVLIDGAFAGQGIGSNDQYRQLHFAPDGSLNFLPVIAGQLCRCSYAAGAFTGLPSLAAHEAEKPGPRDVHNFIRPNIFEDQAEAMNFVLAPGETIYGVSDADGKFKHGTLFRLKTDGSDFTVVHDFYGGDNDGENPTSLLLMSDGSLFGAAGKAFRYDPKSQQFAILNLDPKDNVPNLLAGTAADGTIVGFSGGWIGSGLYVVSMASDGGNYASFANGQFGKPPLQYSQIVAGKDGTFFAISTVQGAGSIVKFKSLKDVPALVHKFVNSPTDGYRPEANLVLDNKGNLYGTTSAGGMSQNGVIYKIDADGSNYQVVYDPDEFAFSRIFVPGDDGMLYGLSKDGLLQLTPDGSGKPPTTLVAFDGAQYSNHRGVANILFHNGAVYGLHGAAIYKVTLPQAGAGATSVSPTVTITPVPPPPLVSEAITFTDPTGTATAGAAVAGGESTTVAPAAPAGAAVSGSTSAAPSGLPNSFASAAAPFMPASAGAVTNVAASQAAPITQMVLNPGTTVEVKMIDSVDSSRDPAGKQYRAAVFQSIGAGNGVVIPQGAAAVVTLVQDASGEAAHLASLTINGQLVSVNGSSASVVGAAAKVAKVANSLFSAFGARASSLTSAAATLTAATGDRVVLPQGTRLSFVMEGNP